ncbi:MAG TPA: uracil-DNA glycosylase family protein [Caulobacteraceae bacterium]|nr:uracil-DNA glycosylase family protein [Caulobacteraceae bacterium]
MSLASLLAEIRACRACAPHLPHEPRPVLHVAAETRLLICGQAPGRRVHESGLSFDDPSGDRLRGWLGIDRERFYGNPAIGVAAMAFCYPGTDANGGDHAPPARCAALWRRRLLALLPNVELTVLLGRPAHLWALGARAGGSMDATVRHWRAFLPDILVLPHPSWRNTAWLKRNPWFDGEVTPYLRARVAAMMGP